MIYRFIGNTILFIVLSLLAFFIIAPLWAVIGYEICFCISCMVGLTWTMVVLVYGNLEMRFQETNQKLDELLRRTKKDEL